MGWAERLNPNSDWNLRNARRIVALHEENERKKRAEEAIKKLASKITDEVYGEEEKK